MPPQFLKSYSDVKVEAGQLRAKLLKIWHRVLLLPVCVFRERSAAVERLLVRGSVTYNQ